jgi:hypothetical protein
MGAGCVRLYICAILPGNLILRMIPRTSHTQLANRFPTFGLLSFEVIESR